MTPASRVRGKEKCFYYLPQVEEKQEEMGVRGRMESR